MKIIYTQKVFIKIDISGLFIENQWFLPVIWQCDDQKVNLTKIHQIMPGCLKFGPEKLKWIYFKIVHMDSLGLSQFGLWRGGGFINGSPCSPMCWESYQNLLLVKRLKYFYWMEVMYQFKDIVAKFVGEG